MAWNGMEVSKILQQKLTTIEYKLIFKFGTNLKNK